MNFLKSNFVAALLFLAVSGMVFAPTAHAHDDDLIIKPSAKSVKGTIDALKDILLAKGITVFGRVDHAMNAEKAGLELPPTELLVFGNPKLGTPLMQSNRKIAIDLPMKALAWQDAEGKVFLGYTDPDELKDRYDIDDKDPVFAKMKKALGAMTDKAIAK
ncbi:MAG: DUF302 domain-containing protein [Filomicrobium sp.]